MPENRKPRKSQQPVLAQLLAIRLQQLEAKSPKVETFVEKVGVSKGTYFDLVNARGNPTLRTIERVAAGLDQSLFELIGFTEVEVRDALKRHGIDDSELQIGFRDSPSPRT